jgi:uncharacterized membrane protein YdjX (TVP38/TMEM64 family)
MSDSDNPSDSFEQEQEEEKSSKWKTIAILGAVIGIFAAFKFLIPEEFWDNLRDWIDGLGHWAPIAFVLIYIVASVILAPCSLLTIASGFIFGVVWGTVWVSVGSVLGASAAFLVGRYFARDWVEKKTAGNKNFQAVDKAIASGGLKIVTLIRLSPLFPYNLLNYFFGVTKVPFRTYVLGSWIGMLPGTIMYVYIGYLGRVAADTVGEKTDLATKSLTVVGFVLTVIVTIMVTKAAKKALAEQTEVEA